MPSSARPPEKAVQSIPTRVCHSHRREAFAESRQHLLHAFSAKDTGADAHSPDSLTPCRVTFPRGVRCFVEAAGELGVAVNAHKVCHSGFIQPAAVLAVN